MLCDTPGLEGRNLAAGVEVQEGGVSSLQWVLRLLSLIVAHATGYFVASFPPFPSYRPNQPNCSPFPRFPHSCDIGAAVGRQKTERDDSQSSRDCVCEARGLHFVAIQSRGNSVERPGSGHVTTSKLGHYGVFCPLLRWRSILLYSLVRGQRLPVPACNMEATSRMHALRLTRHVPTLKMASHGSDKGSLIGSDGITCAYSFTPSPSPTGRFRLPS